MTPIFLSIVYIFYLYKKSYKLKQIEDLSIVIAHCLICETFIVFSSLNDLLITHAHAILLLFMYYMLALILLILKDKIILVKKSLYIKKIEDDKFFLYKISVLFKNPLKFL